MSWWADGWSCATGSTGLWTSPRGGWGRPSVLCTGETRVSDSTLVTGIDELATGHPQPVENSSLKAASLGILRGCALVLHNGRIAWIGPADRAPAADTRIDLGGRAVVPGFVDSHAHLVFAGDRAAEFEARMTGAPYSAGGIRTTVAATRAADDEQLGANVRRL